MKTIEQLTDFLEENGFNVYQSVQDGEKYAEVEMWTKGGVDMIMVLQPFNETELRDYVKNFDIDEEISLHREGKDYCAAFSYKESVKDFENHKKFLESVIEKLGE